MIRELRRYRLFGIALFDLVTALVGMIFLFLIMWKVRFSKLNPLSFIIAAVLLTIPVGMLFHIIFGVNTQLNYNMGLSNKPSKAA